ncbi:hypothetical protein SAMN02745181_0471 [Rubritalea squalenifaciens DSM 18772]|uniref:Uncharacterized protein n=1 Tax=Rubritalea squalenifaciens DSM 18772 TaxID=1123071 RepID=A0A1M6CG73_9BACT|nr:hypothetical protein [Rubritalea squalenifaciens]SHI59986.1 hypothetical protein SAMN02745181_0471 [Rubritalea squalenifaciens DSM 18772]
MSKTTAAKPLRNPDEGTLTPAYFRWMVAHASDEEFEACYRKSRQTAVRVYADLLQQDTEHAEQDKQEADMLEHDHERQAAGTAGETPQGDIPGGTDGAGSTDGAGGTELFTHAEDSPASGEETEANSSTENEGGEPAVNLPCETAELEEDLENMHHKTFQKKYGLSKKAYREQAANGEEVAL